MSRERSSTRFLGRSDSSQRRPWHPPALRSWNLVLAALLCWALIAVLQILLMRCERDGGIIFATDVNSLPLRTSFAYLYLPTIIAVVFSLYWAWIDLDAKRSEPYYQLSKKDGALGRDSLLLHYPMNFIPIVPFLAVYRRHWFVFWSSASTVLIMFGLVPVQGGIFSTRMANKVMQQEFSRSEGFIDTPNLNASLLQYRFSTNAIIAHNETLPPYMTWDYALRPFASKTNPISLNQTWKAETMLYSLDLKCQKPTRQIFMNYDTKSCPWTSYISFSDTYKNDVRTPYENVATFFLPNNPCPDQHAFVASFAASNKTAPKAAVLKNTDILCDINYYEQAVEATVDSLSKAPIGIIPLGPKSSFSTNISNFITEFEGTLGDEGLYFMRGALPTTRMPQFSNRSVGEEHLHTMGHMATMAAKVGNRQFTDYLDPAVLEASYLKAYRVIFARAMTEFLNTTNSKTTTLMGESAASSQAVVLEPLFVYIVEAILGLISVSALAMLFMVYKRDMNLFGGTLFSDPGPLGATMSLVAGDEALLSRIGQLNHCDSDHVAKDLMDTRFKLVDNELNSGIILTDRDIKAGDLDLRRDSGDFETVVTESIRPLEFHFGVAAPLIGLFVALCVVLGILFSKSQFNGLPLPSKDPLVQNIVRNYIPIAIATLIEPIWVLLNRVLCLYLPFQELLSMKANPERSININYSSLPPQLTIWKAFRARHFILASVCTMALLANLLATAFSGLLFQDIRNMELSSQFLPAFNAKFNNITIAQRISIDKDFIVVAQTNYIHGTRLPPWVSNGRMFLPFGLPQTSSNSSGQMFRARTKAFSAQVDCQDVALGKNLNLTLQDRAYDTYELRFNVDVPNDAGTLTRCEGVEIPGGPWKAIYDGPQQCNAAHLGMEISNKLFTIATNATYEEERLCENTMGLGWIRLPSNPPGVCQSETLFRYLIDTDPVTKSGMTPKHNVTTDTVLAKSLMLTTCRPGLVVEEATVTVDANGYVLAESDEAMQLKPFGDRTVEPYLSFYDNRLMDLFTDAIFAGAPAGIDWHSDRNAMDRLNYFMQWETPDFSLIDPAKPLPKLSDVVPPLQRVTSKLLAIWLTLNRDEIFDAASTTSAQISGNTIYTEERLLFNTALFFISEIILGTYILVAILVYARRPGKFLPRLPNSIAAVVSYFAASTAVQDFKDTSHFRTQERVEFLEKKGFVYGYGSFVGPDGKAHVGIERQPFVTQRNEGEVQSDPSWWSDREETKYSAVDEHSVDETKHSVVHERAVDRKK